MKQKHNKCEFRWKSSLFITASTFDIDYKGDTIEYYNIEVLMWLINKIALLMNAAKDIERREMLQAGSNPENYLKASDYVLQSWAIMDFLQLRVLNVLPKDLKVKAKGIPEINPDVMKLVAKLLYMESEILKAEANTIKMNYKATYDSSKQLYFGLELVSKDLANLVKDKVVNESVFKPFRDYYGMYAEVLKTYFLTRHFFAASQLIVVGDNFKEKFPSKLGCADECMGNLELLEKQLNTMKQTKYYELLMEVYKFYIQKRMKEMFEMCTAIREENKLYALSAAPIHIASNTFAFPPHSTYQIEGYKVFEDYYVEPVKK